MTKRRNQPARYELPEVVNPPDSICFEVPVPNDKFHVAAFKGSILALGRAFSWANDDAHTAIAVAAVWMEIFNNLEKCKPCAPGVGFAGAGGDDDLMLRQNPDNPCELQNSVDGVTWCTWADLSLCVSSGQPGAGSRQPSPGGGEECYTAKLAARGQWLLPTSVNAGDTIEISDAQGAATDGTGLWYCPDGESFIAGVCIPGSGTYSGSDPVPLEKHMAIVVKIASTFYKIPQGTPFTVPGGVSNAQVVFQLNDASLSDNDGDETFNVCVVNNAAASWSHTLIFASTPGSFGAQSYNPGDRAGAIYVLGTGWNSNNTNAGDGSSAQRYTQCDILFDWVTSTTLKSVVAKMNTTVGSNAGGSTLATQIQYRTGASNTNLTTITPATGTNQTISWTGTQAATGLRLHSTVSDAGNGNVANGAQTWLEVTVTGVGFDPWA